MQRSLYPVLASLMLTTGCATGGAGVDAARPVAPPAEAVAPVPAGMQWLLGSGEGAGVALQVYRALRDHVHAAVKQRPRDSVVLTSDSTLKQPRFHPCGTKPLAVILDIDETALLNAGYFYDEAATQRAFDAKRWDEWERTGADKVTPVPGAVATLRAIRNEGVTPIFISNRQAANARQSEAALEGASLGPAAHPSTMLLAGDHDHGSGKDARRAVVAERYCVVAMIGDQLGDFSDLFNQGSLPVRERRRVAATGVLAEKWGAGWFLLPNPVYGSGLKGGLDDVFAPEQQWKPTENPDQRKPN